MSGLRSPAAATLRAQTNTASDDSVIASERVASQWLDARMADTSDSAANPPSRVSTRRELELANAGQTRERRNERCRVQGDFLRNEEAVQLERLERRRGEHDRYRARDQRDEGYRAADTSACGSP